MSFEKGDRVIAAGLPGVVEATYPTYKDRAYVILRDSGHREVWMSDDVRAVPPPEDPARRKAVDLILDFTGVPRDYLFEYPYNEHESRTRIREAETLLDKLIKVLDGH